MINHTAKSLLFTISLAACTTVSPGSDDASQLDAAEAPLPSVEDQLKTDLAEELGRPVSLDIDQTNSAEQWQFLCGRPLETDGRPFDYESSRLAEPASEQLIDDYFCALFEQTPRGLQLRELTVATTDTPVFDWLETYDLPAELFAE